MYGLSIQNVCLHHCAFINSDNVPISASSRFEPPSGSMAESFAIEQKALEISPCCHRKLLSDFLSVYESKRQRMDMLCQSAAHTIGYPRNPSTSRAVEKLKRKASGVLETTLPIHGLLLWIRSFRSLTPRSSNENKVMTKYLVPAVEGTSVRAGRCQAEAKTRGKRRKSW